jgi:hypothetical protein
MSNWQERLTLGRRYSISWDDCCAAGEFTATVVEWITEGDDVIGALFDNGVSLYNLWGRLTITECEAEAAQKGEG